MTNQQTRTSCHILLQVKFLTFLLPTFKFFLHSAFQDLTSHPETDTIQFISMIYLHACTHRFNKWAKRPATKGLCGATVGSFLIESFSKQYLPKNQELNKYISCYLTRIKNEQMTAKFQMYQQIVRKCVTYIAFNWQSPLFISREPLKSRKV